MIGGSTAQATLVLTTEAAPSISTGSLSLSANALVEYQSGGITTIGSGASLTLNGADARGWQCRRLGEQQRADAAIQQPGQRGWDGWGAQ